MSGSTLWVLERWVPIGIWPGLGQCASDMWRISSKIAYFIHASLFVLFLFFTWIPPPLLVVVRVTFSNVYLIWLLWWYSSSVQINSTHEQSAICHFSVSQTLTKFHVSLQKFTISTLKRRTCLFPMVVDCRPCFGHMFLFWLKYDGYDMKLNMFFMWNLWSMDSMVRKKSYTFTCITIIYN